MNGLSLLLFATQTAAWAISPPTVTVGDTVRITRRFPAGPDARFVVLPLAATPAYLPLSSPIAAFSEGAVVVRYQLAFFQTGDQPVPIPDLELHYQDGRNQVFPGDTAWVHVTSILPAEAERPPPRPSLGPVARTYRSTTPAISIVAAILVALGFWAVSRRRTSERPRWPKSDRKPTDIPLQQWIMAGESKAAVGVIFDRLRGTIERSIPDAGRQLSTQECLKVIQNLRPDWPRRDIEEVLRSLDRAQYAPAVPSDVALLVDQVEDILKAINAQGGDR